MGKIATLTAYGKALAELIVEHDDIIVLDADLTKSTKTNDAQNVCPQRHFNIGIAEGNMMGIAAGLAASNKIVYASSFAMFAAGRAFEQIRNSIAYPNLNVKNCATHAGITVGEDGASHQAIEDLALMRSIPNMNVFQPCDAKQTEMIIRAVAGLQGPCYVRLGRNNVEEVYTDDTAFTFGKGNVLCNGKDIAVFASGMMVQETLRAADILKKEGICIGVIDMPSIKPIDEELICRIAKEYPLLVSCEEHTIIGGLGSAIAEVLCDKQPKKLIRIGMQDCFGESGTSDALLYKYGLNGETIAEKIKSYIL